VFSLATVYRQINSGYVVNKIPLDEMNDHI